MLNFTGVKNIFSVSVFDFVFFLFFLSLCHSLFLVTSMLVWDLKVIGNTLARLVNGVLH